MVEEIGSRSEARELGRELDSSPLLTLKNYKLRILYPI